MGVIARAAPPICGYIIIRLRVTSLLGHEVATKKLTDHLLDTSYSVPSERLKRLLEKAFQL